MSLFVFVVACSVQNDDVGVGGIRVADGKIKSPQWLVSQIDSIADIYNRNPNTGERIYSTIVSLVEHKGNEYIHIADVLSSHSINGNLYFTISGVPIEQESNLYTDLPRENNRRVLWTPWGN
jgi:hypothetical protein